MTRVQDVKAAVSNDQLPPIPAQRRTPLWQIVPSDNLVAETHGRILGGQGRAWQRVSVGGMRWGSFDCDRPKSKKAGKNEVSSTGNTTKKTGRKALHSCSSTLIPAPESDRSAVRLCWHLNRSRKRQRRWQKHRPSSRSNRLRKCHPCTPRGKSCQAQNAKEPL